jgi:hypothetical protein
MSEIDKLVKRLSGVKNFHVSWGPEAHKLSSEQRAKAINDIMDEIDARNYEPMDFPDRPTMDIRDWMANKQAEKIDLDALDNISVKFPKG